MSEITLSKSETTLLVAAAGRDGALALPESMKPVTRNRLVGRLLRDGLILTDGEAGHGLTPAGYRAVGLRPPRVKRAAAEQTTSAAETATAKPGTKQTLVLALLGRGEGASLSDLTEATGWLPHTTRAALSRIRSAGTLLTKSKREGEATVYRIVAEEPPPVRRTRKRRVEASVEAVA